jgi:hypothetical protein
VFMEVKKLDGVRDVPTEKFDQKIILIRFQSESDLQINFDPLEISERHRSTGTFL